MFGLAGGTRRGRRVGGFERIEERLACVGAGPYAGWLVVGCAYGTSSVAYAV